MSSAATTTKHKQPSPTIPVETDSKPETHNDLRFTSCLFICLWAQQIIAGGDV